MDRNKRAASLVERISADDDCLLSRPSKIDHDSCLPASRGTVVWEGVRQKAHFASCWRSRLARDGRVPRCACLLPVHVWRAHRTTSADSDPPARSVPQLVLSVRVSSFSLLFSLSLCRVWSTSIMDSTASTFSVRCFTDLGKIHWQAHNLHRVRLVENPYSVQRVQLHVC